ncbi:hypothetical protein EPO15_17775 [bacterium]|nr:MAG: hypothetical protein EPO15_17775 [bacterium]
MKTALLAALLCVPARAAAPETAAPAFKPECVLAAVAGRKGVVLDPARPLPMVLFASSIPVSRYREAAKEQLGGMEVDTVLNMYVVKTDEIYIQDAAANYGRFGRTIDDSVAHEFGHYLQVVYDKADVANDANDSLESEAVALQTWFREVGAAALPESCRR